MTITTNSFDLIKNVSVTLTVELGRVNMKLADVMSLQEESIISLDRLTDDFLDVFVNGNFIAKGEIVNEGSHFGLRIIDLADNDINSKNGES